MVANNILIFTMKLLIFYNSYTQVIYGKHYDYLTPIK